MNTEINKALKELFTTVGTHFAIQKTKEINKSARQIVSHKQLVLVSPDVSTPGLYETKDNGFGTNEEWVRELIKYFNENNLKDVVGITDTTRQQIIEVLTKAQTEGWGIDRIVNELEADDITAARAKLIVRTESVKAMNQGDKLAKSKSRWETEDTWLATGDDRTRESHREVDGDTIGTRGKFKVPIYEKKRGVNILMGWDFMDGPGDPNAHISNLAYCRCRTITHVRRDDEGRLIPKQNKIAA